MADLLNEFIEKYILKGFKVSGKGKSLKYGLRVILKKERKGFLASGFNGIYIYYYDGKATLESISECLKDYVTYYNS